MPVVLIAEQILVLALYGAFAGICIVALLRGVRYVSQRQKAARPGLAPGSYILISLCAWAAETNLIRSVSLSRSAQQPMWSLFTLWWPPEVLSHGNSLSWARQPELLLVVLGVSLGAAVTLGALRLRNAALPVWIALLALVPFANLGLFIFLSIVPARPLNVLRHNWTDYLLPRDQLGSAVVACLITAGTGIALSQFGTVYLGTYGWALFALIPVAMGFLSAAIYGASEPRSASSCMWVALASVALGGLAILGFAIEGAVCVLMAAPLALPLAALGGWLGYLVQRRTELSPQTPQIAGALLLFLPFMMYGEHRARTDARQIAVSTSIVIHAPADRVWQSVIHLASVPKPESVIFHSVAYPIRTSLEGSGLGATRQCVFSTGSIVEPIKVWDPGRELRFSVVSQPPLMRELTPYSDVHPPHLKLEYLRSREGQFTLTPQADGTTLLAGTSYYESRLWPGEYWQLWTDMIAHQVHRVVLREIKKQSEGS